MSKTFCGCSADPSFSLSVLPAHMSQFCLRTCRSSVRTCRSSVCAHVAVLSAHMSQFCLRTCRSSVRTCRSSVCARVAVLPAHMSQPAIVCRCHLRYFPVISPLFLRYFSVISPLFLRYFSVISPLFPAAVARRVRPLRQQFVSREALGHPARGDDVELLLASPVLLPQRRQTTRVPAQTTGAIWREEARADDCHPPPAPSLVQRSSDVRRRVSSNVIKGILSYFRHDLLNKLIEIKFRQI